MSTATMQKLPASSHLMEHWHSIDWTLMHQTVRGLQVRIAKATKKSDWRQVTRLQRMLTRLFAAKVIAIRRVTENRGKNTAGVDGETWSTPAKKWEAIEQLQRAGYKPKSLLR